MIVLSFDRVSSCLFCILCIHYSLGYFHCDSRALGLLSSNSSFSNMIGCYERDDTFKSSVGKRSSIYYVKEGREPSEGSTTTTTVIAVLGPPLSDPNNADNGAIIPPMMGVNLYEESEDTWLVDLTIPCVGRRRGNGDFDGCYNSAEGINITCGCSDVLVKKSMAQEFMALAAVSPSPSVIGMVSKQTSAPTTASPELVQGTSSNSGSGRLKIIIWCIATVVVLIMIFILQRYCSCCKRQKVQHVNTEEAVVKQEPPSREAETLEGNDDDDDDDGWDEDPTIWGDPPVQNVLYQKPIKMKGGARASLSSMDA